MRNHVPVFGKPGCGCCKAVQEALEFRHDNYNSASVFGNIDVHRRHGSVTAHALAIFVQLSNLTYPQVYVRGRYAGGWPWYLPQAVWSPPGEANISFANWSHGSCASLISHSELHV